ncbi:HD family phosphohydrolase [Listeria sp. PSOL-1]|uniref:HD family phosphohydrolase n=1 Tax=Listeria sp. PSOL-1 TaxID=1844999 RepID=UPI0013D607CD|nr:HD family phosphohydrolase [Listeria sp. PSOL-1]
MKISNKWYDWYQNNGNQLLLRVLLAVLMLVSYLLICELTKPVSYNVKLFSVAERTLRSPQTIEDTKKTNEAQKKASNAVEDVYVFNRETGQNRVALVSSLFDYINEVKKEAADKKNSTIYDQIKLLKAKLSDNVSKNITTNLNDRLLQKLLEANVQDLDAMRKTITTELAHEMENSIRPDQLNTAKIKARDNVELSGLSSTYRNISKVIISYAIVPNETYSQEQTEKRRKDAANSVLPVKILHGQVIVQEGQIVDQETYRELNLLHLLDQKMPIKQYAGYALFVLALFSLLYFFAKNQTQKKKTETTKRMLIFTSVYLVVLILLTMIRFLEDANLNNIAFLFPAAFAPVILKVLLNEKYAFLSVIFITATSLFVFQSDAASATNNIISVFILFSSLASIILLRDYSKRIRIVQYGLVAGILNGCFVLLLFLINNSPLLTWKTVSSFSYAFLGGFGAFILVIGLIPIFEAIFGLLTVSRLIELANPNHPLLKKILMKAPGTYHHSMMVANLAETCADKIGANSLLVRVGCFYHDIGKIIHPPYFVENQLNDLNPHERLAPKQSRDIILAHTTDGAAILKENHMPKPVIDIALEHHGTTLLKYFYYKERERNPNAKEADFRYHGPKPQTVEAAIINISDSVEAAVRSCVQPTSEKMKEIVDQIMKERMLDGQFSECDITMKQIETVRVTLNQTLNGIYHARIPYPDEKKGE